MSRHMASARCCLAFKTLSPRALRFCFRVNAAARSAIYCAVDTPGRDLRVEGTDAGVEDAGVTVVSCDVEGAEGVAASACERRLGVMVDSDELLFMLSA